MDEIERLTEQLLQAVLDSDIYKEYQRQEERMQHMPDLKKRVDRMRSDNFVLQMENPGDLFTVSDIASHRSADLRKIPEANAYLEAELALNRLLQLICGTLFAGIDYNVPEDIF